MALHFVIKSVNEEKREVGGLITCEAVDKDGETLDYTGSKPEFQAWSMEAYNATKSAGQELSFGNVREQHSKRMVGKFVEPLQFDDDKKTIWGLAKIYDDDVWMKTKDGGYNGFSVGGNLKNAKTIGKTKFITIIPREVSIVDNPAVDAAHFDFVRAADGQIVKAAFKHRTPAEIYSDIVVQLEAAVPILGQSFPSFGTQVAVFKAADPAYAPDAVPDQNKRTSQPVEQGPEAHGKQPEPEVKTQVAGEALRPFGDPDTQLGKKSTAENEPGSNTMIVKVSPAGWGDTVEAMKEHPEIENPYALAWYMDDEGYTPHKMSQPEMIEFNNLFKVAPADQREKAVKNGLSTPSTDTGAITTMANEVEKAARLSMHSHLANLGGHLDKCKVAVDGLHAAGHEAIAKCQKLAGSAESLDNETAGPLAHSGDSDAAESTEVKAAKAEIEKLSVAVKTLTESVAKLTAPPADDKKAEKSATAETVVGDKSKAQPTGEQLVEKAAQARKEAEADLELAKAAFGVDKNGQKCMADPNAMNALYAKLAKRGPAPGQKATN